MITESTQRTLRADARRNRESLIAAAREVFAEQGPDGSLEEVARRAGLGVGTLYRHFPTRFDLQEAVLANELERNISQAEALERRSDSFTAVRVYLRERLNASQSLSALSAAVWQAIYDGTQMSHSLCEMAADRYTKLVERAQEQGTIRSDVTPKQLMRLVNGIVLSTENSHSRESDMEQMFEVVMNGLRPGGN